VVALGELTSRLIGDKEIRTKIIEAAKARNLPTTIGKPKTSFLLLFDLVGSSDLSHDTELKARAYGNFYDLVNKKAQEQLRGVIRKTIGDAVIITWDGSDHDPSIDPNFVHKLRNLAQYADFVAKDIGCKGARALLHYGKYFLGLVGTETFGQIDVIGSGIDEVCKLEGLMKHIVIDGSPAKLAISCSAIEKISSQASYAFVRENLVEFDVLPTSRFNIKFACTLISGVRTINHAAG
jgi:class 3 adenylate cyclase